MIDIYLLYNIFNKINEKYNKNNKNKQFNKKLKEIINFTILITAVIIYTYCNDNEFEIIFTILSPVIYILYKLIYRKECLLKYNNISNKNEISLNDSINSNIQKGGYYTANTEDTISSISF